eukprot:5402564-Pyramimonas_sp.AAC.1
MEERGLSEAHRETRSRRMSRRRMSSRRRGMTSAECRVGGGACREGGAGWRVSPVATCLISSRCRAPSSGPGSGGGAG